VVWSRWYWRALDGRRWSPGGGYGGYGGNVAAGRAMAADGRLRRRQYHGHMLGGGGERPMMMRMIPQLMRMAFRRPDRSRPAAPQRRSYCSGQRRTNFWQGTVLRSPPRQDLSWCRTARRHHHGCSSRQREEICRGRRRASQPPAACPRTTTGRLRQHPDRTLARLRRENTSTKQAMKAYIGRHGSRGIAAGGATLA